jgi:microcystin degradation protein MlrC
MHSLLFSIHGLINGEDEQEIDYLNKIRTDDEFGDDDDVMNDYDHHQFLNL